MAHHPHLKEQAILLRTQGKSLSEIAKDLGIVKSTAYEWVKNTFLTPEVLVQIKSKERLSKERALITRKKKQALLKELLFDTALHDLHTLSFSKQVYKLICALLWWCEGNKDITMVRFTNSDVTLIQNFLISLRKGFSINETKLRVLVHIHEYHEDQVQKKFWSDVTKIPLNQFHTSYLKPHTGKRKHTDYQGCIAISYYDAKIAKELKALYNAFTIKGVSVNG